MPAIIHIPLTMVAGIVGGMIAGAIPGFLKAYHRCARGHRYADAQLRHRRLLVVRTALNARCNCPVSPTTSRATWTPQRNWRRSSARRSGLRVSYGIFIAAAVVIFARWFLDRSSLGFDFRITGNNPNAARASGINARRVIILVVS